MGAKINNQNRSRGKSFEKRVASKMGNWYRIPYSGSSALFGFGDVRDKENKENSSWMIECKTITPRSKTEVNYIIKEEWLTGKSGIVKKAKQEFNKFWALAFTKKNSSTIYIVVDIHTFKAMVRAIEILKYKNLIPNNINSEMVINAIDKLWEEIQE